MLLKAGELGSATALTALADLHADGIGGKLDHARAHLLYAKAYEMGNSFAAIRLGKYSEEGVYSPNDYHTARAYYQAAIKADIAEGYTRLAKLYERGDGVPQNFLKAFELLELGEQAGHSEAKFRKGIFYLKGWGVEADKEKAYALFYDAALDRNTEAMMALVKAPKEDRSIRKSYNDRNWLMAAFKLESSDAAYTLARIIQKRREQGKPTPTPLQKYDPIDLLLKGVESSHLPSLKYAAELLQKESNITIEERQLAQSLLEAYLENGHTTAGPTLALSYLNDPSFTIFERETLAEDVLRSVAEYDITARAALAEFKSSDKPLIAALNFAISKGTDSIYHDNANAGLAYGIPIDQPLQIIRLEKPKYPTEMLLAKESGKVVVAFTAGKDGSIAQVEVVESTHPGFNLAAIEAIENSQFQPAVVDGKPVSVVMRLPIHFVHPEIKEKR